jgi:undecaprenyl-diphosphatase
MESHLQAVVAYFATHPWLALAAIFAASFAEALAFVGTFVPGGSIVFVGGVLIGMQAIDPWWSAGLAIGGAILGDGASYSIGRRNREGICRIWPVRDHPGILERGRAYFERHGGKSVFLGRFIAPVRAIVPVVAGMGGMPPGRFFAMNVLSALAWAAAHLLSGALFGASLQLAAAMSSRLIVVALGAAAFIWLVAKATALLVGHAWPRLRALRARAVAYGRARHGLGAQIVLSLLDPERPASGALLAGALVLAGSAWLFLGVLEDVVSRDPLVQLDQSLFALLQGLRSAWLDRGMVAITELGGVVVTSAVVLAVAVVLAFGRRWRTLSYWLAAIGFGQGLVQVFKVTLERQRPIEIYAGYEAFSFPSGHATMAIVVYGFLAYLLARGKPVAAKTATAVAASLAIAAVSFSRLYLGAHWFSDVVAGLSLGLAWVTLLGIAHSQHVAEPPLAAWRLGGAVAVALVAVGGWYVSSHEEADLARYGYRPQTETISAARWKSGFWRELPAHRAELAGEADEPLSVQWAGPEQAIKAALAAAGWQRPPAWTSRAVLLWLAPSVAMGELPALPKFNRGEPQALAFMRPLDRNKRLVLRLWPTRYVISEGTRSAGVLWIGMATLEELRSVAGISFAETSPDFITPALTLARDLQALGASSFLRQTIGEGTVILLTLP